MKVRTQADRRRPTATAVCFMGATITYAELEQSSASLGLSLREQGVRSGDPVAIIMSIKLCLCGAVPVMVEIKRGFEALTGGQIV